jgi:hypothetical protein
LRINQALQIAEAHGEISGCGHALSR